MIAVRTPSLPLTFPRRDARGRRPARRSGVLVVGRAPLSVLGVAGLAGLLTASAWLAIGAAGERRWFFVPASIRGGFPDWLAGPLHALGVAISPQVGASLLVAMFACYLVVLACARALPAWAAIAAVVLAHLVFLLGPPLFSADVFGYVDYARLDVLHGLNPYDHGAIDALRDPVVRFVRWRDIATPYGPLFTLASSPLAWLSVPAALWACKSLAALLSLACVALVWRIARLRGIAPVPAIVFVGLNPLLLAYGVGGAHNDFALLAPLLLAIVLVLQERPAAGGLAGALAFGVKASSALVLPFLVLGTRRRRAALAGAVAGCALVLLAGAIAFQGHVLGFASQIHEQQRLVAAYSVPSQLSSAFGFHDLPHGVRLLFLVAFVGAVLVLLWRTWHGADWLAAAGWASLGLLVSTAWLVPWYVVWLLPLAAVGRDRRLWLAALAFCAYVVATRVAYQLL
jgi:alpha-1,6-mannosyltransferase